MGPTMLNREQVEFPTHETRPDQNVVNKERKKVQLNFHTENYDDFLKVDDYSKFRVLQCKVAYLRCPFRNKRNKRKTPSSSLKNNKNACPVPLLAEELREAEIWLIRKEQAKYFGKEVESLKKAERYGVENLSKGNPIPKTSSLYSLTPFLDEDGLIRLGGRIERSLLPFDSKHPVILPKQSCVTELLIERTHEKMKHFGVNAVLALLQQHYWPIRGRELVKRVLKRRVLCRKLRGNPGVQIMADLPPSRVGAPNPPFTFTGVDFFGPIIAKAAYRGSRRNKRYGALFTCFQTCAVHLEVVQ